jgi:hypothetical protein
MNLFTDFHHNSLLRSTVLLFENRLGINVYRPIGMDWFNEGCWAINDSIDTAKQFLDTELLSVFDQTPLLNSVSNIEDCIYEIYDPGNVSSHKAISLDLFKNMKFDYIIASIPQHIPIYKELIKKYQPSAKLIIQIGNNWPSNILEGCNVLASVKQNSLINCNAVYYHQEFDTSIFKPSTPSHLRKVSSYINILQNMPYGWSDFLKLEIVLDGVASMKSYGGQCRDGNKEGPISLSSSMRNDDFIFHVKDGGDGYGHILYNAFASARPVITRSSFYKDCLGYELLNDESIIDLDKMSLNDAARKIIDLFQDHDSLNLMSKNVYRTFKNNVDFVNDAEKVRKWIENI